MQKCSIGHTPAVGGGAAQQVLTNHVSQPPAQEQPAPPNLPSAYIPAPLPSPPAHQHTSRCWTASDLGMGYQAAQQQVLQTAEASVALGQLIQELLLIL